MCDDVCIHWPIAGTPIIGGEEYGIEWIGGNDLRAGGVNLYYTIDAGITWVRINQDRSVYGTDPNWGLYTWRAPNDFASVRTPLYLKVENAHDPAHFVISGACSLRKGGYYDPLSSPEPADYDADVQLYCNSVVLACNGLRVNVPVDYTFLLGESKIAMQPVGTIEGSEQFRVGKQLYGLKPNTIYYWRLAAKSTEDEGFTKIFRFKTGGNNTPEGYTCSDDGGWALVQWPNGGETFTVSEVIPVKWMADNSNTECENALVEYYDPQRGSWRTLDLSHELQSDDEQWGITEWKIPESLAGKESRIRVIHYCAGYTQTYDESDATFRVIEKY
jgi:hypothetical protein